MSCLFRIQESESHLGRFQLTNLLLIYWILSVLMESDGNTSAFLPLTEFGKKRWPRVMGSNVYGKMST
jgi:hypothetical protein